MSSGNRSLLRFPAIFCHLGSRIPRINRNNPCSQQRKDQITGRRQIGAEHSAPVMLKFTCSGLGLESGQPSLPGYRPQSNAWTALRRSLSKQLPVVSRSFPILTRPEPPNHAEVRSSTSLAYSEYRISTQRATSVNRTQQLRAQPQPG